MTINLAEKLKSLRNEKNTSQEKLAKYLDVSCQAISKWENGNSYPDISLLPDIARFFGITVDELLCIDQIDEKRLYAEYEAKAADRYRCGEKAAALSVWQEAYHQMPNNIDVKSMLLSAYFDTDRVNNFDAIFELATDIYNSNAEGEFSSMYYKGQAIRQLAGAFAEHGDIDTALNWARKTVSVFNSKEIIEASVEKGDDLLKDVAFCAYWFLEELFYLVCYIHRDQSIRLGDRYWRDCCETVAQVYESVYKNDDMGFEQLQHLCNLHQGVAEYDAMNNAGEDAVRSHMERSLTCCIESMDVKAHRLDHPMLYGWQVKDAPSDRSANLKFLRDNLKQELFDPYREKEWFIAIENQITEKLASM